MKDFKSSAPRKRYSQQLQDLNWKFKADNIRIRDKHSCRLCGEKKAQLDVHHIRYIDGRMAWEYDDGDLVTLCHKCHEDIHDRQNFDQLQEGDYFYDKLLQGVGIVERKTEDAIYYRACWTEDSHYSEKGHGRLFVECMSSRNDARPATKEEVEYFWEKVGEYYDIEYIIELFNRHIHNNLAPDHFIRVKARECFKQHLDDYKKVYNYIQQSYGCFLLVSNDNFAYIHNARTANISDWTVRYNVLPQAVVDIVSKQKVKDGPSIDNVWDEDVLFENIDLTGYRAATSEEISDFYEFQSKRRDYIENVFRNPEPLNMVDFKELLGLDLEDSPF